MTTTRTTNTEFVTELMEFSKHGALMQAYILMALQIYSEQVAATGTEHFENGFVNGQAWVGCANEILQKLKERYDDAK